MKFRNIIIIGAAVSLIAGFAMGKIVNADAPAPGSSNDPVVSKSYVDKAMQNRLQELEKQVADLTVQSQALQTMINELQAKVNKIPTSGRTSNTKPSTNSGSSSSNNSGSSSNANSGSDNAETNPGGTTPATKVDDSKLVGKTAYVREKNNYVNLRSGPSTDTAVVKKVYKGSPMGIQKVENGWLYVLLGDGTQGWVADFVVEVK